ncbi:myelin-associated neurite-outgrowth inhibitor isoform X1 [Cyclopterus lumpus]|uniref:myelin-associated neurite-outgrowth inhibitor isoform X1 n=1 Tax=Cyclopterus lumpus TaxID=8103 RepID=UPI001485D09A|nr:myelin-associated neurite-outgrowth inhibitor isoform X1 [Cyclopterus lumpus]XP_034415879.1 myelin-associated neurite-outgrowth inhibitor isoform X1 [Cyclopterus lumpus]XP_034415880.1 myelin-associated neurite-outgrowth inhibitor isoform X1 [Cyclopterus lumpus]XP_034415881.1 myelin-associated neurite-outgrowth inhibitor isoform X1 [Cyclopterus lumpus]
MNPVYSPSATGVPFTNTKGMGYPVMAAGFPVGYAAAAPAYTHNIYAGANAAFPSGYAPGTPFKMSCSPNTGTVPPYSTSPNPYAAAMYPVRSTYPQQNPYAQALIPSQQQGTYYTQPLYAAPPHVIHHTTVVQPNGMPAAMYQQMPHQRHNSVAMGMVAGTTMAMSAGTLLTTQSPASVAPHQVSMPTYRHPGTPSYSYVPPQW